MSKNWKKIRTQIREARNQVPAAYAQQASYKFSERIGEIEWYRSSTRVAGYLPFEGEANPLPLMDRAIQDGKEVFVPIIISKGEPLKFARWNRQVAMAKNGFGIPEPKVPKEELIEGRDLDFVVAPLVAFDDGCNRLGVGGGFYDRTFAHLLEGERADANPKLVGLAYELQRIETCPRESWDVKLDMVVSELQLRSS